MRKLIAAAVVLAAAATALPVSAQVFDGPYAGAQVGWNHDKIGRPDTDIGSIDIRNSEDSFTGGAFVGYNHKVAPRVVLGVEGGFEIAADDDVRRGFAVVDPDYTFDVSARAGYLVDERSLIYVRGGYENSRASVRMTGPDGTLRGHDNFDGWSVGGGVERALTDRISARIEYRYSDLGGSGETFDRHKALLGVAYHF
ncbi:outer membrane protein [Sphingopyxis indica]|uniref:Outer membrane immunogenic protein n=1 Tax=Sphingopyxis indica TaxID=436663 RepID=A0A239K170_9SPHN|nr:porin family protein [Sphingopyxis indica]SNT10804.1 outer membrane immunogenic protein [Sphingopyxis indica]